MRRRNPKAVVEVRSPTAESKQHRGRVKWFNAARGYGFILEDDRPDVDIFLHHRNIQVAGFRELVEGQPVLFTRSRGPKGPVAFNVLPIHEPAS